MSGYSIPMTHGNGSPYPIDSLFLNKFNPQYIAHMSRRAEHRIPRSVSCRKASRIHTPLIIMRHPIDNNHEHRQKLIHRLAQVAGPPTASRRSQCSIAASRDTSTRPDQVPTKKSYADCLKPSDDKWMDEWKADIDAMIDKLLDDPPATYAQVVCGRPT